MSTYLSKYEDHLTEIIERGGSEIAIESAVAEYNRPSMPKLVAWVKQAGLTCSYCERLAEVTAETRPSDEVTCAEHRP